MIFIHKTLCAALLCRENVNSGYKNFLKMKVAVTSTFKEKKRPKFHERYQC